MEQKTKTHTLSLRLADHDWDTIADACRNLDLSKSDYIRYLLRVPLAAEGLEPPTRCIVIDRHSLDKISRELIRWGYHYNQAVHAMNSIAMRDRNGTVDVEWLEAMIAKIDDELELANDGCRIVAGKLDMIREETLIEEA